MSKIDLAWKCFLEDSRNVAGVLNLALNPGGTACFTPGRIKTESPYEVLASDDMGNGKSRPVERLRDSCFTVTWGQGESCTCAIMGIENQSDFDPLMAHRVLFMNMLRFNRQRDALMMRCQKIKSPWKRRKELCRLCQNHPFRQVFTLVVNSGRKRWPRGRTFQELVAEVTPPLCKEDMPQFRMRVLDLCHVPDKFLPTAEKNLRTVIKYMKNRDHPRVLRRMLEQDEDFKGVPQDTVCLIKAISGAKFEISENEEKIDMCYAEKVWCKQAKEQGRKEGKKEGKKEGNEQGMSRYAARLNALGVAFQEIVSYLAKDFKMSQRKARIWLEEHPMDATITR